MSDKRKKKFIADDRIKNSQDFQKPYENLDIQSLSILLEAKPYLINQINEKTGISLLFRAVINDNFEVSEYLLERNADPNIQNIYSETPLHYAVENSNHKLINLLLEKGANPNIQQIDGETPMHIAAAKGDYKIIKLLNLYQGDVNISTYKNYYKPIDYAQERGDKKSIEVLNLLMEKQKIPNEQKNDFENRSGLQTTKNSDSPMNRLKNNTDMLMETPWFKSNINNTCKNSNNKRTISENYSQSSVRNIGNYIRNTNLHSQEKSKYSNNFNVEPIKEKRKTSYNVDYINSFESIHDEETLVERNSLLNEEESVNNGIEKLTFLNDINNFGQRIERIKKGLENVISSSDTNLNCENILQNKLKDSQRHDSVKDVLYQRKNSYSNNSVDDQENDYRAKFINANENNLYNHNEYTSNFTPFLNISQNGTKSPKSICYSNHGSSPSVGKYKGIYKIKNMNKLEYNSNSLPKNLNYETLINSHYHRKMQSIYSNKKDSHEDQLESRLITLRPQDEICEKENYNFTMGNYESEANANPNAHTYLNNFIARENINDPLNTNEDEFHNTRITYTTNKSINKSNNDDVYNFPLKREISHQNHYDSFKNNNVSVRHVEAREKHFMKILLSENFEDYNKVLAVFISTKNDINEGYVRNIKHQTQESNKLPYCNRDSDTRKYEELFHFNLDEVNDFIANTENASEEYEDEYEEEENPNTDRNVVDNFISGQLKNENLKNFVKTNETFLSKKYYYNDINNDHFDKHNYKSCENNIVKYFSKSKCKDDSKHISIDTHKLNDVSVSIYQPTETNKNMISSDTLDKMNQNFANINKGNEDVEYNCTEAIREMSSFLKMIDLEFYTQIFIKNGFDDLQLLIEQMKSETPITDENLKAIGIIIPGHRAKILLKLEEDSCDDFTSNSLYSWLANLKMEQFFNNFLVAGYHSIDLLYMQMNSKNLLTEKTLEEEIGIKKVGYRIRILNKLLDDSKIYVNKLKVKLKVNYKGDVNKESCNRCIIY